jgi:sugar lactone lactonase YvrE
LPKLKAVLWLSFLLLSVLSFQLTLSAGYVLTPALLHSTPPLQQLERGLGGEDASLKNKIRTLGRPNVTTLAQTDAESIVIATGLLNPRGVAILPDGRLLVAEAGTGFVSGNEDDNTGMLSLLNDLNRDGHYDLASEKTPVLEQLPGYNILYQFNPGRDEIVGLGDVLVTDDDRIFFTLDDNFEKITVTEVELVSGTTTDLYLSLSTLNSIAYDAEMQRLYLAESSNNAIMSLTLDGQAESEAELLTSFGLLEHGQQAVPSGIAVDPQTGDVLVALFSGNLWNYYGSVLSFMPGDAKVVRVDPQTGSITDEITGLTAAVDVAVDEAGNLYVVELTTEWPTPTLSTEFELFDPDAPPDAGGYVRFSGRVTMYPVDETEPFILADNLDAPTNITYHNQALYVSVGQGTPGRPIWVDGERRPIVGELLKIIVPTP